MKKTIFTVLFLFIGVCACNEAKALSIVHVGVMLPFKSNTVVSDRAVDFYRGLMMAVDSLKKNGTSFRIYTYNTAEKPISAILKDTIVKHLDIIFGPDDAVQLKAISDFTESRGTKLIDAFCPNTEVITSNPNFYVLYSSDKVMADDAVQLFAATFHKPNVIVVDTKKTGSFFVVSLKNAVKKVRFLQAGFSLNELASRLSKSKENIFVLSSADKESALAFFNQLLLFKKTYPEYTFKVIGYPEWGNLLDLLQSKMHQADTYMFTSFFNNALSPRNLSFTHSYKAHFHKNMTPGLPAMALYGFDSGYFLLKGMALYGKEFADQNVYAVPLQNGFFFKRFGNAGGLYNHKMQFVHYRTDQGVELIEKK